MKDMGGRNEGHRKKEKRTWEGGKEGGRRLREVYYVRAHTKEVQILVTSSQNFIINLIINH